MSVHDLTTGGCGPFDATALLDALKRRMDTAFHEFRLPNQNPDVIPHEHDPEEENIPEYTSDSVTVYRGALPKRKRDSSGKEVGPQWPLVLVRVPRCKDEEGDRGARRSTVHVEFVLGARRLNEDGCLDVMAIAEHIRTNLLRDQVIESRARLELPLEIEIGEDESFPQWVGLVSAQFTIPQPVEEIAT